MANTHVEQFIASNPEMAEHKDALEGFVQFVTNLPQPPKGRPGEGTLTGRVWTLADSLTTPEKVATRKEVMEAGKQVGLNEATLATQYQRWLKAFKVAHPERFAQ